jgi:hypothetical protein
MMCQRCRETRGVKYRDEFIQGPLNLCHDCYVDLSIYCLDFELLEGKIDEMPTPIAKAIKERRDTISHTVSLARRLRTY